MTVAEVYDSLGESYEEIHSRLEDDEWIAKYLKQFVQGNYKKKMNTVLTEGDWIEGYKAVHNIKGLALNLGLTGLAKKSVELGEELKNGVPVRDITGLLIDMNGEYDRVVDAIKRLD